MSVNDGSGCYIEPKQIACPKIMGSNELKTQLQGDIFDNLSDSREFLKGMNGVVIDKDQASGDLAQLLLKKLGAQCFHSKGLKGIEDIIKNGAIDFIIINPEFYRDGSNKIIEDYLDFLNLIKEQHKDIQIFAYTADVYPEMMNILKKLGFADIITKPMDFGKFNNSLKTHLRPDLLVDNLGDQNIKPSNED